MKTSVLLIHLLFAGFTLYADLPATSRDFYIPANGTRLYCKTMGTGEPLVILHGGPGLDQSYFLPQMEKLAADYMLIFYDQRGCGKSDVDVDTQSITMLQNVEDLEAVRVYFKLDKMNLLGHSFGGLLAMNYAIRYPGKLKRLVLVTPTPQSAAWRDSSFRMMSLRSVPADKSFMDSLSATTQFTKRDPATMALFFRALFRQSFYNPQYADSLTLNFSENYPKTSALMQQLYWDSSLVNYDLTKALDSVKCPTLIIGAEADMAPPEALEELHRALKNSEYSMIESCGHFPFVEAMGKFRELLLAFMKKH